MGLFADLVEKPAININRVIEETPEPAAEAAPEAAPLAPEQAPVLFGLGKGAQRRQQLDEALGGGTQFGRSRFSSLVEPAQPAPTQPEEATVTPQGYGRLVLDEGERLKVYKDTKGIETIGVGFNLREPSNRSIFQNVVGFDVDEAIAGRPITRTQSRKLLEVTAAAAEADVRSMVPKFDTYPPVVQDALVNFMFNVGKTTASKFKNTFAAINRGDGKAAADGLRNSAYYKQVGQRGERVAQALEQLGKLPATPVAQPPQDAASERDGGDPAMLIEGARAVAEGVLKDSLEKRAQIISHRTSPESARKAAEVLTATEDVSRTWKETGVWWSPDGPAEVISDKQATLITDKAGFYEADKLLKHDELFLRYPELRETAVKVEYTDDPNKRGGAFSSRGIVVTVMKGDRDPDASLRSILLHELQHGVQKLDNVAGGGDPDNAQWVKKWAVGTYGQPAVDKVAQAATALSEGLEFADESDEIVGLEDDFGLAERGGSLSKQLGLVEWEVEALKNASIGIVTDRLEIAVSNLDKVIDELDEPLPPTVLDAVGKLKKQVRQMEKKHPILSAREIYLAQRGESVSRYTQKAANMSVAEQQAAGMKPGEVDDVVPGSVHNEGSRVGQSLADRLKAAGKMLKQVM